MTYLLFDVALHVVALREAVPFEPVWECCEWSLKNASCMLITTMSLLKFSIAIFVRKSLCLDVHASQMRATQDYENGQNLEIRGINDHAISERTVQL